MNEIWKETKMTINTIKGSEGIIKEEKDKNYSDTKRKTYQGDWTYLIRLSHHLHLEHREVRVLYECDIAK